ncbi:ZKSCAN7, partial [Cervus elaphus hippelaphus]
VSAPGQEQEMHSEEKTALGATQESPTSPHSEGSAPGAHLEPPRDPGAHHHLSSGHSAQGASLVPAFPQVGNLGDQAAATVLRMVRPQIPNPVLLVTLMTWPIRLGMSLSSKSLSFREAAELEFLSVNYTQKWKGAALSQRALYQNIMLENCHSLGPLANENRMVHSQLPPKQDISEELKSSDRTLGVFYGVIPTGQEAGTANKEALENLEVQPSDEGTRLE